VSGRVQGSGRPAFGVDPPLITISPELRWLLFATFSDGDLPPGDGLDRDALIAAADAFDLVPRLMSRRGSKALGLRLGQEPALSLRSMAILQAVETARILQGARSIAALAEREGVPVVFLKNTALVLGKHVKPGSRSACDIDALVRERDIPVITRALATDGWEQTEHADQEHHLAPFAHARFGLLELHRNLPFVRRSAGAPPATLEALDDGQALVRVEGRADGVRIPGRHLLAAHLLAHGLVHHIMPTSYPQLRVLGDLIDLNVHQDELDPQGPVGDWLGGSLDTPELAAIGRLLSRLRTADASLLSPDDPSPEARLLRHIVAGTSDPDYRESLKLLSLGLEFGNGPRPLRIARSWLRMLVPAPAAMRKIYSPAKSRSQEALRHLWRPFDLILRVASSVSARRRVVRKRSGSSSS
jgi:Uncharacterised nucleotidyltransferase